jgi:hypothetical protein
MLTITVESTLHLDRYLAAVKLETDKEIPAEVVKAWRPKLVQWQQENIDRQTGVNGQRFAALSPATIAAKRREGSKYVETILMDSSAMYQSIQFDPSDPPNVARAGATALSPNGFPYPEAVNRGTSRMPARPWSGLRAENVSDLEFDLVQRVPRPRAGRGGVVMPGTLRRSGTPT